MEKISKTEISRREEPHQSSQTTTNSTGGINQIKIKRVPSPKEESSLSRVLAKRSRKSLMQETKITLMRALGNQSSVKVGDR